MEKGIITIGRQYGSQGRAVGKMLAQRLGCAFYDKEELARIARGRDYEEVREFYEEQPVDSLLYAIAMNNEEGEVGRIPFARIRELCGNGPCVLIGRCGNEIFRKKQDAVSIFIHGDMEKRVQYVTETEGLSAHGAKKKIDRWMRSGHLSTGIIPTENGEGRMPMSCVLTAVFWGRISVQR